jgi:hypothetical protein
METAIIAESKRKNEIASEGIMGNHQKSKRKEKKRKERRNPDTTLPPTPNIINSSTTCPQPDPPSTHPPYPSSSKPA